MDAYNPPPVSESVAQMKVRHASAAHADVAPSTPSSTSLLLMLMLLQALAVPTWDDLVQSSKRAEE